MSSASLVRNFSRNLTLISYVKSSIKLNFNQSANVNLKVRKRCVFWIYIMLFQSSDTFIRNLFRVRLPYLLLIRRFTTCHVCSIEMQWGTLLSNLVKCGSLGGIREISLMLWGKKWEVWHLQSKKFLSSLYHPSSSYPYPTKWGRYMFSLYCDKDLAIIFTTGVPDVNPPWNWSGC
jgi:hypothetical protein